MITATALKINPKQVTPQYTGKSSSWADALPGLLGTVGSVGGSFLGGAGGVVGAEIAGLGPEDPAADVAAVPAAMGGSKLGSIAGGSFGQGVGDIVKNLIEGKGFKPGETASQTIQGGMYGAIPGGKTGAGIVKNAATRFLGGSAIGAGVQGVRNIQEGNPLNKDIVGQGIATGAINTLTPGISGILKLPAKGAYQLGKTMVKSSENIATKKSQVPLNAIQYLFGKGAISTGEGKAFVNPMVDKIIKDYNIPLPPKGNISDFKPALDTASEKVENQLKPLLDSQYVNKDDFSQIINKNKDKFLGVDKNWSNNLPKTIRDIYLSPSIKTKNTSLNLYQLKNLQREIGDTVKNWSNPVDKHDLFAMNTYKDLGSLIEGKLETQLAHPQYKDLINQHKVLIDAKDSFQSLTGGRGILPPEVSNEILAQEKAQGGLSGERLRELGIRSTPLALATAANLVPGTPEWLKWISDLGALGSAGYEMAQFGPHTIGPQLGTKIGKSIEGGSKTTQDLLQRSLQQLGVRIPGMGQ